LLVTVWISNFLAQEYHKKAACKMLMQLTTGRIKAAQKMLVKSIPCFSHFNHHEKESSSGMVGAFRNEK